MIERYKDKFPISKLCDSLNVSRSGYYDWRNRGKSDRQKANEKLLKHIKDVYQDSRMRYGSPRITEALKKQDIQCSRPRVARLMRKHGIRAVYGSRFKIQTTDSDGDFDYPPNLLKQDFSADKPNQVWLSDITYVKTTSGFMYLAVILDVCSNRIIGVSMKKSLSRHLVISAFKDAVNRRELDSEDNDLIFHSDRGSQYMSNDFRNLLNKYNIKQSMSSTGNCYDNAKMESFFGRLKEELISLRKTSSVSKTRSEIFEYIEVYYNKKRLNSGIDYHTPVEYERKYFA